MDTHISLTASRGDVGVLVFLHCIVFDVPAEIFLEIA